MKKLYTFMMLMLISTCVFAQSNGRLLVRESSGNVVGFLTERVDSLFFDVTDYGRVAADVTFKSFEDTEDGAKLTLEVKRTENCEAFRIAVIQKNLADRLTDDAYVASQLEYVAPQLYWDDFTNAEMTGFDEDFFVPDADYSVLTMGYDKYGIACQSSRADFHTPAIPVTGNPDVAMTVDEAFSDGFTLTFKPNSDTREYYFCLFGKGEAEAQFAMYGPMFGFPTMGDMIKGFGIPCIGEFTYTYTGQAPDTEYDIYIQALDVNGVNAPLIVKNAKTAALGGDGPAEVTITIGESYLSSEGQLFQPITFTPNENVALYRELIVEKKAYETTWETSAEEYLKIDQPGNPYWDFYKVDSYDWALQPGTEYLVFALAKNAKGEWGELAQVEFKTPGDAPAAAASVKRHNDVTISKGVSPFKTLLNGKVSKETKGLQLIAK